jgi:hypothetical protein
MADYSCKHAQMVSLNINIAAECGDITPVQKLASLLRKPFWLRVCHIHC